MIGGFLSQPAQKYPSAFRNLKFFEEFPFILPMIFAAVLSAIILLISYFKIKETLKPPFENFTNSQDDSIQYSPEQNSWRRALFDYRVIISVSLFSLLSFSSTFMEEAIPLWLVLDVDSGGFSMESKDIGTLISIASPFQLMFQAFVFPKLAKLYGFRAVFSGSMAVMGTSSFILPFTSVFVPKSRSPSFKHWIPLLIVYIIYVSFISSSFFFF